ncbi:MAG: tetratricopeptide repeat protein, partial [Myxococcota bacterium]
MTRFARHLWFSVLIWALFLGSSAGAQPTRNEIAEQSRAARKAGRGPEVYAELRALWMLWEREDPNRLEAALGGLAVDPQLAAPARAYAGLLEAYARRRRGDLAGAQRRVRALGYVPDWLVVGPFDNDNRGGLAVEQVVERELTQPVDFERSYRGKERAVKWRRLESSVFPYGFVDFGSLLRPQRDICGFATTFVEAPKARTTLSIWVGATGAYRLYVDGAEVMADEDYRQLDADRRASVVELRTPGYHRLTIKVCGDEIAPSFSLRLADRNGEPAALRTSVADAATTAAAGQPVDAVKKLKARVAGPLDAFGARTNVSAEQRYAFARYLTVTGGEAQGKHVARDLAQKAAEAEPTVSRLLLAAALAEDRNGSRGFLERAEPLAKRTLRDRIRWLLAQARWLRSGPNPRDAFHLYTEVLRLDPDAVEAVLGEVDLYVEAGLPRTALDTLNRALERQPHSVALLRQASAQLRSLGREAEAVAVERRYAALRFDDPGYLRQQIDLAVLRRQPRVAERWAQRLLSAEPHSTWARSAVAQARLRLGDRQGALRTYDELLQLVPEDTKVLREVADLHGMMGDQARQRDLLQRIVRITPQSKQTRAYLEHISPAEQRLDERYAWPPERFLAARVITSQEHALRILRRLHVTTVFNNGLAHHFKQVVFQPQTEE